MLSTLAVHGFRSLRDVVLPLQRLTVVTGANGSGKSNLYRAFALLADVASGRLVGSLAAAGGLSSVLWAGPEQLSGAMRRGEQPVQGTRRTAPISLQLGFSTAELSYLIDIGLPVPGLPTMFARDPVIKRELIWAGPQLRPAATLVRRTARGVQLAEPDGLRNLDLRLPPWASLLDELADPDSRPELGAVRATVRSWRFYDSFRVDPDAPARQPQVGTRTEVLSADGHDLAPALQTVLESAWEEEFRAVVRDAFPGTAVDVADLDGRFEVRLRQPGMLRPLATRELSDGTLRYLLLATALLSPRPPGLLVVNEPETSLHPEVLPALARLLAAAAQRTQVVVITHAPALVAALAEAGALRHELVKELGETTVEGQGLLTRPSWQWGSR